MGALGTIGSIANSLFGSKPVKCGLAEVDPDTGEELEFIAFQYFPETIEDSRSPIYSSKDVPGGSHPIKQFISGGNRSVSFTAIFTQEENPQPLGILNGGLNLDLRKVIKSTRKDTVNIAGAVAWLRSFTYPTYDNDIAEAPPPVNIYLPNSGIIGTGNFKDSITAIMTQCNVTYEAFHRDGTPRIIAIQLAFDEFIQTSIKSNSRPSSWKFIGADVFADDNFDEYKSNDNAKMERIKDNKKGLKDFLFG